MKPICFVPALVLASASLSSFGQKVLIDNDKIKVTEYISAPGAEVCGAGMHTHKDHVTILLNDAKVRTTKSDGTVENEDYSANKHTYTVVSNGKSESMPVEGTFWVKGSTHTVVNTGKNRMHFYIIEPK